MPRDYVGEYYQNDPGDRIGKAIMGFGLTILNLRQSYDTLQFERQAREQAYQQHSQTMALQQQELQARLQHAEWEKEQAAGQQRIQLAGHGLKLGAEGQIVPMAVEELPVTERLGIAREARIAVGAEAAAEQAAERVRAQELTGLNRTKLGLMTLRMNATKKQGPNIVESLTGLMTAMGKTDPKAMAALKVAGTAAAGAPEDEKKHQALLQMIDSELDRVEQRRQILEAPSAAVAAPPAPETPTPPTGVTASRLGSIYRTSPSAPPTYQSPAGVQMPMPTSGAKGLEIKANYHPLLARLLVTEGPAVAQEAFGQLCAQLNVSFSGQLPADVVQMAEDLRKRSAR